MQNIKTKQDIGSYRRIKMFVILKGKPERKLVYANERNRNQNGVLTNRNLSITIMFSVLSNNNAFSPKMFQSVWTMIYYSREYFQFFQTTVQYSQKHFQSFQTIVHFYQKHFSPFKLYNILRDAFSSFNHSTILSITFSAFPFIIHYAQQHFWSF